MRSSKYLALYIIILFKNLEEKGEKCPKIKNNLKCKKKKKKLFQKSFVTVY